MTSAPRRFRSASRGAAYLVAGVVAAVALAPGSALAASSDTPAPPGGAHSPSGVAARGPAFGAFLHYGSAGVRRMKELSRWLDGQEPRVGHT